MARQAKADSKGRVLLGEAFADAVVLIEDVDATEVRVLRARVIPERELWLHRNAEAMRHVQDGLDQARRRQFADAPDLTAAARFAEELQGE